MPADPELRANFTVKIKCCKNSCDVLMVMDDLQEILNSDSYEKVHLGLTKKMLHGDPNFISCPNPECKSFGFTLKPAKCSDDYECSECNYTWRTSEQSRPFRFYLPSELSLFSNLYKVVWGEKCPGCQVFITHAGGCKFMECPLCKFQFCWWC